MYNPRPPRRTGPIDPSTLPEDYVCNKCGKGAHEEGGHHVYDCDKKSTYYHGQDRPPPVDAHNITCRNGWHCRGRASGKCPYFHGHLDQLQTDEFFTDEDLVLIGANNDATIIQSDTGFNTQLQSQNIATQTDDVFGDSHDISAIGHQSDDTCSESGNSTSTTEELIREIPVASILPADVMKIIHAHKHVDHTTPTGRTNGMIKIVPFKPVPYQEPKVKIPLGKPEVIEFEIEAVDELGRDVFRSGKPRYRSKLKSGALRWSEDRILEWIKSSRVKYELSSKIAQLKAIKLAEH